MKALILGWDFPPYLSCGLKNSSFNLVREISNKKISATIVLPYKHNKTPKFAEFIYLNNLKPTKNFNFKNLIEETEIYKNKTISAIKKVKFDVIHCHNWMTFKAGLEIKKIYKKPLIIQADATFFNRKLKTTEGEYEIEKEAFENADKIIVPSETVKKILINKFNVDENKIKKIYFVEENKIDENKSSLKTGLFIARNIENKEAEYFLKAVKLSLSLDPNLKFIISTKSEHLPHIVEKSMDLRVHNSIKFIDWINESDVSKTISASDFVVVPYGADSFGLEALKAIKKRKPVIMSNNLEISKTIKSALKHDMSDAVGLAEKILALNKYDALKSEVNTANFKEARNINKENFTENIIKTYREVAKSW